MSPPTDRSLIGAITDFLTSIGLPHAEMRLAGATPLPGVTIESGRLLFDPSQLPWPGDLLHEAGHIAVTPEALRPTLRARLETQASVPHAGEVEATAWAFAAIVALGLEPTILFHEGGYGGSSRGLAFTFSHGVYPGAAGLEAAGMTVCGVAARARGVSPYPHMIRWLRA